MSQKAAIPDDDFKEYLDVLLGNKDNEKVMELMSKAETAMCEIQGQSRGIMGIPAIAVAAMAISNLRHHEWSRSFRQPNSSPYKSGQSEWQGSAIVGWLLRK